MELTTMTGTPNHINYAKIIRDDTIMNIEKRIAEFNDPTLETSERAKARTFLALQRAHEIDSADWWVKLNDMGNVSERIYVLAQIRNNGKDTPLSPDSPYYWAPAHV